jgi:hypothetical protein
VIAYYTLPGFRAASEVVADAKARGGLAATALATIFASLVLPDLARAVTRTAQRIEPRELAFRAAFFATVGVMVDLLYRGLALLIGTTPTWDVVLRKALFDQFLFSPLVSIPLSASAFLWRDHGFRWGATLRAARGGAFVSRYVPMMITCWAFWLPTLFAVFAMPVRLQFILFLLAQAAWSLLLVYMAGEAE